MRRWSPAETQRLRALVHAGMADAAIAKTLGRSHTSVMRKKRAAGLCRSHPLRIVMESRDLDRLKAYAKEINVSVLALAHEILAIVARSDLCAAIIDGDKISPVIPPVKKHSANATAWRSTLRARSDVVVSVEMPPQPFMAMMEMQPQLCGAIGIELQAAI